MYAATYKPIHSRGSTPSPAVVREYRARLTAGTHGARPREIEFSPCLASFREKRDYGSEPALNYDLNLDSQADGLDQQVVPR